MGRSAPGAGGRHGQVRRPSWCLHLSFEEFQIAAQLLSDTVRDWGGELNAKKTKWMHVRSACASPEPPNLDLHVDGALIEKVSEFCYLGSIIADDADLGQTKDVQRRIQEASKTFGCLRGLWKNKVIHWITKRHIFLACVKSTLLYGAESWILRGPHVQALRRAWYGWIRNMLGLT